MTKQLLKEIKIIFPCKSLFPVITFPSTIIPPSKQILFETSWGVYDMVIGNQIISAFAGPADPNSFDDIYKISKQKTTKILYSHNEKKLFEIYNLVKSHRLNDTDDFNDLNSLSF